MKNIAYLMNGVIGGLTGKNYHGKGEDLSANRRGDIVEYVSLSHKFLQNKNTKVDYFIFSWEPDLESVYIKQYSPKKIKCISQITFDMPEHFQKEKENIRIQAQYSRWYGAKEVMKMGKQYMLENNIEYDLVMNARLDLCFHKDIDLSKLNPSKFHMSHPVNLPNYNWPKSPQLIDHIFVSNTDNMYRFLQMYDYLDEYTKPNECPSWRLMSSHFLCPWHLSKLGMLNQDILSESFTTFDGGYDGDTDYHIFRDRDKPEKVKDLASWIEKNKHKNLL